MKIIITRKIVEDPHQHWDGDNEQDRLEFERGDWHLVGVYGRGRNPFPIRQGLDFIIGNLKSPGLWGVQSHSDEDYFNEIFEEEVKILKGMIEAFRSGPLEYEICKENEGYASELGV